jgi:hypothetical protein
MCRNRAGPGESVGDASYAAAAANASARVVICPGAPIDMMGIVDLVLRGCSA